MPFLGDAGLTNCTDLRYMLGAAPVRDRGNDPSPAARSSSTPSSKAGCPKPVAP